jgi:hypothetical protein
VCDCVSVSLDSNTNIKIVEINLINFRENWCEHFSGYSWQHYIAPMAFGSEMLHGDIHFNKQETSNDILKETLE